MTLSPVFLHGYSISSMKIPDWELVAILHGHHTLGSYPVAIACEKDAQSLRRSLTGNWCYFTWAPHTRILPGGYRMKIPDWELVLLLVGTTRLDLTQAAIALPYCSGYASISVLASV